MTALREYPIDRMKGDPYQVEVVSTEEGLDALRREWIALYEESAPRNPMFSYEWAAACWANMCPGARLFVVTARAGGRLVGVAPLRLDRQTGFRVLRFLLAHLPAQSTIRL